MLDFLRRAGFAACIASILSGCAPDTAARRDTALSNAPDANGFLIIGTADENARTEWFFVTKAFQLTLVRSDGRVAKVARQGCNTYKGLFSGQSCASDRQLAWQVVELPAGDWGVASVHETIQRGFPARFDSVDAKLPPGITVHVGPGEIVYAGDFLFSLNPDTLEGHLKTYSRNDAAASHALSAYPNLPAAFIYREPAHPVTGGS